MADFRTEKALVEHLLQRLGLHATSISNANPEASQESGNDAVVVLEDGSEIGIQVTEVDPYERAGHARAAEARHAKAGQVYGNFAQNDQEILINALTRSIRRKCLSTPLRQGIKTWLLVSGNLPWQGASISTFVLPLALESLEQATGSLLDQSCFDRCFIDLVLDSCQTLYSREKGSPWTRSNLTTEIHPRSQYVAELCNATVAHDESEIDRLVEQEVRMVLTEMRKHSAT